MASTSSEQPAGSGRVFTRNSEPSARRRLPPETPDDADRLPDDVRAAVEHLRAEHDRLQVEVVRMRTLIGQSIRVIEEQNARLREHGLEPVAPTQIRI